MNNPAVTNLVLSLGAMQVARRIPMDDPQVVNYLRIAYATAQLLSLAIYYYITLQIRKKNDLTVLKYVNPASPMNPDAKPELVQTTVKDYDLAETGKAIRSLLISVAIMTFLHGYMKYTQPLFIQSIMGLKGALESNPAKLHLWNKKAEGDLARPFKASGGMFESLTGKATGPQTDAASIKEAEKAGKAE
ncbi:inorganic phosphate transporter pho88 [Cryptococcus gattii Ru294]|uniref:Inorganic phosphate transporter pho88, putative n=5 Tax=Cryptococcus gattii species complex TaxID=1884637 RepID=E6R1M0_CRYGW|nr:inorganic phosphate transporter pho88, putative [Cryptococcus gattii WM276]KIR48910.1 inorganic phosphate transporter pho88 [Cryptococcus bacillisporus CA1280]KIR56290.1 inorganic phosphate transporter pho88 [Cryptococcus gattii Ru294]KIR67735.1 inorganic phosphate transporter pho88 [Cryptococcus bacillisporus CA1873]KIR82066.1 inorganic phosphate transporter pho88 [Cryptococcus gattii EJB2]KIY36803.1 inorganic phosphate transporter pho88 [Cryptococcus gattii E566]KJE04077.1 inorganic phos|eukprot:KIR67735.1 inorganic phosphate transporter pho88 [Cryptococcus gattii CA1873]